MIENCKKCYYEKAGKCKRFPPKPIEVRYYNGSGVYNFAIESTQPDVYEDDYCGEFRPRDIEFKPMQYETTYIGNSVVMNCDGKILDYE